MGRQLLKEILRLMIIFCTFFFAATFTQAFGPEGFSMKHYLTEVRHLALSLPHIADFNFQISGGFIRRDLFPFIFQPWFNTLKIFILSLLIAIAASFIMTGWAKRFKRPGRLMKVVVDVMGLLPDIFVMPVVILIVILIYQRTNVLIFDFASTSEKDVVLLPAVLLSIVPFVQFYKILDQAIDEQLTESYVMMARAKGLSSAEVLIKHVMRNIAAVYYINFRQVVWMTLSSLFVMEILFGIFGATSFLYTYRQPEIILTVLILMFIPLYLMFIVIKLLIERMTGVKL